MALGSGGSIFNTTATPTPTIGVTPSGQYTPVGTAVAPAPASSSSSGASGSSSSPSSSSGSLPYATMTPGYNGNPVGTQQPSIFGTGQYTPQQFPINDEAITGAPSQGESSNYGLNGVWNNLQNAVNSLQVGNYTVPAATSTAAQGSAALAGPASYQAAQMQGAQGTASMAQGASGQAAMGNTALSQAAQGGYATAGGTNISTAGDASMLAQQQSLANTLATQANGGGVSPADLQLQQGEQQNVANQLAVLGSQRGSTNAALAQRSAAQGAAAAQQNTNAQMGIQRAQETLNAQNALGTVLDQARGQSQNLNINQAQLNQQTTLANTANAQAAAMQNAGFNQQTNLANQAAANNMTQFNAGAQNAMTTNNVNLAQQNSQFNAGQSQAMTLANMQNSQAAAAANQAATNTALGQNASMAQQSGLANQSATNAMTSQNMANAQQTNLANQAAYQQTNLANQSTALAAQNQYNQQLLALLGGQTGIGEANRSAALADQQLQVQQNTAANEVGAQAFASAAAANANLAGSIISGIGSLGSTAINAANAGSSSGGTASNAGTTGITTGTTTGPGDVSDDSGTPVASDNGELGDLGDFQEAQLSDENVKSGVEGGNPMLASFFEHLQGSSLPDEGDFDAKTASIDPTSGASFQTARTVTTKTANPQMGAGFLGTVLGAVPIVGGALAYGANAAANSLSGSGGTTSHTQIVSPATGYQQIGVTDDDEGSGGDSLSDDQAKENVISGNQGMQSFLEQANAQQKAQGTSGATSNAFMSASAPPSSTVDRQLPTPSIQGATAGYGAASAPGGTFLSSAPSAGGFSGGGLASMGGYQGGAYQPGSVMQGAGLTAAGGYGGGGMTSAGGVTAMGGVRLPAPANATATGSQNPLLSTPGPTIGQAIANGIDQYQPPLSQINSAAPAIPGGALATANVASPIVQAAPLSPTFLSSLSDEDAKADIHDPSDEDLSGFLDAMHAHKYRYKDPDAPGAGHGTFVSPMAQELEQSPLGRSFVHEGADGLKRVDYNKMAGTMLAGQAFLNERVSRLEKSFLDKPGRSPR